jgi:PAS domain S-box-containing protein
MTAEEKELARRLREAEMEIAALRAGQVDAVVGERGVLFIREREYEEKYRSLFESIDEGFCMVEMIFDERDRPVDYRFLEVNPAFERQTGLRDIEGRTMREVVPAHETQWFEIYGRIARSGAPERFEMRAEQLRRWYTVYAWRYGEPSAGRVAVLFNDITERREEREALRCSEERLRVATESARAGMWSVEFPSERWEFNLETARVYGLPDGAPPDIAQVRALTHPDDRDRLAEQSATALGAGGAHEFEYRIVRPDGEVRWLLLRGRTEVDAAGRPRRNMGIVLDITERKEARQMLEEWTRELERRVEERTEELRMIARKLDEAQEEERGRIAAGLHDSLCQILSAGLLKVKMGRDANDPERRRLLLNQACELLDAAGSETRNLIFDLSPETVREYGFPTAAEALCGRMQGWYGIRIEWTSLADGDACSRRLGGKLYACLRELLQNVVKHAEAKSAAVQFELVDITPGGNGAVFRLTVHDDGQGFDPRDLDRPLTREGGFGLRRLRENVRGLGGTLSLECNPGDGTRAVIEVPAAGD